MKKYDHGKIERKWQKKWESLDLYRASDKSKKEKYYCLIEFPYPSGEGLHCGHPRSYTALDIIARKKRMNGFNVLYPIGFDSFGLPSENYAIKTGVHPSITTKKNVKTFTRQLKSLGFSFDWSRQFSTTDPDYYKWTQWIFLKLYEKGLAYKSKQSINWCLSCKIGLANEEVVNGKCERCGGDVEKREKEQWMLKITAYADRLIEDLKKTDYLERIKIQQINWIGRSHGANVRFEVKSGNFHDKLEVFTTRPDTLFGCTYMVVAPEHSLVKNQDLVIENQKEVREYVAQAKRKSDLERTEQAKNKTGVELKGVTAVNPVNGKEIPIFVADYVLMGYGTGAIMAVPAHDERDWDFAKKFDLPIIRVIEGGEEDAPHIGDGKMINSEFLNGLKVEDSKKKMTDWLEEKGCGEGAVNYKLRDWVFSRQRYWGEPIPMVNCPVCGWVPLPEKELPLKLPNVKKYEPTDTGESPLATIDKWVNTKCPKCGDKAKRETDTMPNWAGSSWYFLRYIDPHNNKVLADPKKLEKWAPVDWYNGGMEHTTLHLLYSRFWYKFLYDIGAVPKKCGSEPYIKRTSHGMVLGEGGEKMSKSRGNVVNPDDVVKDLGADTLRMYEMFMGPFDQAIAWDTKGIQGVRRFLDKTWNLVQKVKDVKCDKNLETLLHQTIKKVTEDVDEMKFNTAISAMMILVNRLEKEKEVPKYCYQILLTLLAPFAPHITEELWNVLGNKKSIHLEKWPQYDKNKIQSDNIEVVVQVNGKVRHSLEIERGTDEEEVKRQALSSDVIKKWIDGKEIRRTIYVKDKLVNIVV